MSTIGELAVAATMCGYCMAERGEECTTTSGARATYTHATRLEVVRPAYLAGFEDGQTDAVLGVAYRLERTLKGSVRSSGRVWRELVISALKSTPWRARDDEEFAAKIERALQVSV